MADQIQSVNQTPPAKSAGPPPPPKMFTGPQGLTLIFVLTLAVIGWILYLYQWQKGVTPSGQSPDVQVGEYVPVDKAYVGEPVQLFIGQTSGSVSIEEALANRRSRRTFSAEPLTIQSLSQILWAANGITDSATGARTAPSGHGLYPFTLYVVVRNVAGVDDGLYHYVPEDNQIKPLILAAGLLADEGQQASVQQAPAVLVYGAIYSKAGQQYEPEAAIKSTLQESGHIAENVYLQTEALNLATVIVGGFDPAGVKAELRLPDNETVVYLQPIGNQAEEE
jgi:SagB-type dehydrogenase family enzyme